MVRSNNGDVMIELISEDKEKTFKISHIHYEYFICNILYNENHLLGEMYHMHITNIPWYDKVEEENRKNPSLGAMQCIEIYKTIAKTLASNIPIEYTPLILIDEMDEWSHVPILQLHDKLEKLEIKDNRYDIETQKYADDLYSILKYVLDKDQKIIIKGD